MPNPQQRNREYNTDHTELVTQKGAQVALREYIESQLVSIRGLMDERDKQYDLRFRAAEVAVAAAFAAQEKAIAAALAAQEKAVGKAELAQADYNVRSNEFRASLDDQAKTLMPRAEYQSQHQALEDKVAATAKSTDDKTASIAKSVDDKLTLSAKSVDDRLTASYKNFEDKLDSLRSATEKATDLNSTDIKSLRESRAGGEGSHTSVREDKAESSRIMGYVFGGLGVLFGLVGIVAAIITLILRATGH